jgi:hypothetical protein
MGNFGAIAAGLLVSLSASAADDCRLSQPIDVGTGNLVQKGLYLRDAKFDENPRFIAPSKFDPATDVLHVSLFQINWNNTRTGFLGGNVSVVDKNESQGFSENYSGNFNFQSDTRDQNGVVTYTTQSVSRYTEPQHAKNDAITSITVVVDKGKLVSLRLSTPVFKVWKIEDHTRYIAFTGEHQTLCLKSAK